MNRRPFGALFPCRRPLLAAGLVLLGVTAAGRAGATAPVAGTGARPSGAQSFDKLPDVTTSVRFTSSEGRFSIIFPSGCAKVHSRLRVGGGSKSLQDANLVFTNCDREGRENEGCSVVVRLGAARGLDPAAAANEVLDHVKRVLAGYDVAPAAQTPVRRDFGPQGVVEGIEIFAHPQAGAGDVWVRGLLHDEDIYVLTAWKAAGGLAQDPAFPEFFQSFLPWADAEFMRGR